MEVLDLGIKSYEEVWNLQKELVEKRAQDLIADTLILVEHLPVYTVGRAGIAPLSDDTPSVGQDAPTEIKVRKLGSVPVTEIERGGKLTFHGPGQLVGYPIFKLGHRDLRKYLRDLERVLMSVLIQETLLPARPCPETLLLEPGQLQTGVWIQDRKIASIGIAVKHWVAYHGFALNLKTDLRYFEAVEPCGFSGSIMTTLERQLGADADIPALTSRIKAALIARFDELSKSYGEWNTATETLVAAAPLVDVAVPMASSDSSPA
ncbi:MAG: lipoyl(octanoyl) transferase LipB [Bdellovibrionota bacterium]